MKNRRLRVVLLILPLLLAVGLWGVKWMRDRPPVATPQDLALRAELAKADYCSVRLSKRVGPNNLVGQNLSNLWRSKFQSEIAHTNMIGSTENLSLLATPGVTTFGFRTRNRMTEIRVRGGRGVVTWPSGNQIVIYELHPQTALAWSRLAAQVHQ